ncbi:MAG: serine/threonine-protein kinase [Chloroflexota bacterium]
MDLIGQTIGNYQIVERLGEGGMASVYRAHQTSLDRFIAIKVLAGPRARDDTFRQRFDREAKSVAQLSHPNIVPIHDFGEDRAHGLLYIVTDLVKGGSLHDAMRRSLTTADAVRIIQQVAAALDYAHARGVIHRDIKPSNSLLTEDGRALLSDFGIAKIAERTQYTDTGATVGTPAYMSPEQVKGEELDRRSDVYALGLVAYQLLAGRLPFQADTPLAILHQQVYDPPPPLRQWYPRIPRKLESVVGRALAKERDKRYRTAGEFAAALERASHGAAIPIRLPRTRRAGESAPTVLGASTVSALKASTPSKIGALAVTGSTGFARFSLRVLWGTTKWLLRALIPIAIIAVIVGIIGVIAMANLGANIAERAITSFSVDWRGLDPDKPLVVPETWLQARIEPYVKIYALDSMQNTQLHLRPTDGVDLSATVLGNSISVETTVFVVNGAMQMQVVKVNGLTPYIVGGIFSDGVNRGLRQVSSTALVALERIVIQPGQVTIYS